MRNDTVVITMLPEIKKKRPNVVAPGRFPAIAWSRHQARLVNTLSIKP